jgi:hypothetical protein
MTRTRLSRNNISPTKEDDMGLLSQFGHLDIDWNLSPEHAVTMYLEWGNNNWHAEYPPVRSKADYSTYFVVDMWGEKPVVRLVRRNSEAAEELVTLQLPNRLANKLLEEYGDLKCIMEPTKEIKAWLRKELGHD